MNTTKRQKIITKASFTVTVDSVRPRMSEQPNENAAIENLSEKLYADHYTRIFRYFSFRLGNKADAEDLAQTVFLKIFTSLKKGFWDGAGDICYIFTVARNTLIDHFRRGKHAVIVSDEILDSVADTMTTSGPIEDRERRELLSGAMEGLHTAEAEALTLRFFADMEYRAIAEIMGKREDAIRQLVHRGLKALKVNLNSF